MSFDLAKLAPLLDALPATHRPAGTLQIMDAAHAFEPNPTVPSAQNASVMLTGYAYELIAFAGVVQNGAQPLASISDARKALELIDEIYRQGGGVIEPGKKASVW